MHGTNPATMPKIYTIPPDVAFLPALAQWFLQSFSQEYTSDALIFLPTRRACRAFSHAMLTCLPHAQKAMILPRIVALAEAENEPVIQHLLLSTPSVAERYLALPPAISGAERRVRMQRLVSALDSSLLPAQSLALADDLLELLDECHAQQISAHAIRQILPENMAEHWQVLLPHLHMIIQGWPEVLAELGKTDPILRRNSVLGLLAECLQQGNYTFPVIAAGSTGSQPATASLLLAIAKQPNGALILSGLDTNISDDIWDDIDAGHPQFAIKTLLQKAQMPRLAVDIMVPSEKDLSFWPSVFYPEKWLQNWREKPSVRPENLFVLDHENDAQEAQTIALLIRETLEHPNKKVALITPSTALMDKVCAILARYDVLVQSSAGSALRDTPSGVILRLVIEWMQQPTSPRHILALLQHPLVHVGFSREACLQASRLFEKEQCHAVISHKHWDVYIGNASEESSLLLRKLKQYSDNLCADAEALSATVLLKQSLLLTEQITTDDQGKVHLWHTQEAAQWQQWSAEWLDAAQQMNPIHQEHLPTLIESMLAGSVVRQVYAAHPRIEILSSMEARLLHFDRVILAGLNEGHWPELSSTGPWISAAMRTQAGLPSLQERTSQQALDFYLQAHSTEVFCTYSHKIGSSPALPSRWLERLFACLQAQSNATRSEIISILAHPAMHWRKDVHAPDHVEMTSPPDPSLSSIHWPNHKISATTIERLKRNPYAVYVSKILRINPLEPLDAPPTNKESGTHLHAVLQRWKQQEPRNIEHFDACFEAIWAIAEAVLKEQNLPASISIFWEKSWRSMLQNFLIWEMDSPSHLTKVLEQRGEMALEQWSVHATPDRIDQMEDGTLRVIDYKSKNSAGISAAEIKSKQLLQLPIAALIAYEGGFTAQGIKQATTASALEYWTLKGPKRTVVHDTEKLAVETYVQQVKDDLAALLRYYALPQAKFLYDPEEKIKTPYDNDMPHLARVKEWR